MVEEEEHVWQDGSHWTQAEPTSVVPEGHEPTQAELYKYVLP